MESPTPSLKKEPSGTAAVDVERNASLEDIRPPTTGFFGALWALVQKVDAYGVELRGIERVLPHERVHSSVWDVCWLWVAGELFVHSDDLCV